MSEPSRTTRSTGAPGAAGRGDHGHDDDAGTADAGDDAEAEQSEDQLSYEEARDQLLAVVQRLETGGVSLQESVDLWERGERLAETCQRWLDGARARLDAAINDP